MNEFLNVLSTGGDVALIGIVLGLYKLEKKITLGIHKLDKRISIIEMRGC